MPVRAATHHQLPCHQPIPVSGAPIQADGRYRLLTSGIQIRLTKPFRRIVTRRKPICRHPKSGLPKTSANHKSDIGSLQCPETVSAAAPNSIVWRRQGGSNRNCDSGKSDADGFRQGVPVAWNPCRKENGRNTMGPRRLFTSKAAGPVLSGLRFKIVPQGNAMASSAIMERSARYRAGLAAGGTAMAPRPRPADAIETGIRQDSRRRGFSLALRLSAAGRKRNNAQQNAYRCLPPGGNQGCRRSR
jgi:hypothetical protein